MNNFAQRKNRFVMHCLNHGLILLACSFFLSASAGAQSFAYEGTITFIALSGKDCGGVRIGDSRPVKLTADIQGAHIAGYSQPQDGMLGQIAGTDATQLQVTYPDPQQAEGHSIALSGIGKATLTGELHEKELRSDEAGCNWIRGKIVAQQIASGQAAEVKQQELAQAFQAEQQEYAARQHDPQAYDEIARMSPEIAQAETQGREQPTEALRLREQLQPLIERTYGAESSASYANLNAQARLHEKLHQFERALVLRQQTYQLAKKNYPQTIAAAAYNLGDVLEKTGRNETALAAFVDATQADEKQYGLEHLEVATDLQRQAQLLAVLQRQSQAVALYQRILAIREKNPDSKAEEIGQARENLARTQDPEAYAKLVPLATQLEQAKADKDLEQAVVLRQHMRPLAEKCFGKPSSRYLADLLQEQADDLETLNRDQEALALYPSALAMREVSYGKEHIEVATTLSKYAYQYKKMAQYAEALPLYQRALAIREKALGPEHADTASSLNNLAQLYETLGQYDQALPPYQRALAIREKVLGPEHVRTATSLNNLANLYETLGQYAQALPLYQRALAIDEKELGADHPETATDLNNLAMLYQTLGQYDQALPLYQRALVIREKALGPEHADTATSLNNLAYLYQPLGQYDQALPLFKRALAIREKVLGPEHTDTAGSLHNLAELYRTLGQYAQALPLYLRALATFDKILGPEHADTAISLSGLAGLYQTLGQYDQALPLSLRVLAIKEKVLGPEHDSVATSLSNLALLYKFLGQYDQALLLHQRALAIREKVLGPEHADTAGSLNNLAALYDTLGQYDQALPLYQRALAIREKILGPEHAYTAQSLNNLAYLYKEIGKYNQSFMLYERALAIREKVFGPEHADTANSLNNLAFLHGEQHHSAEALHWFERAQTVSDHIIQNTFPILTEQQKLKFVEMKAGEMHGMLSLIHRQLSGDQAAIRSALDLVLSRKGIVFDAQARQQDAIARSLDPKTKKLWDALSSQRSELAKLMQNKPERMSGEDYQKHIADYQAAITKLEGQLASKSALIAQDLKQRTITSKEVAQTLGKDSVLAEYVKLQDYDWEHGKWADTWRYLAFILHGDGKIQMVDLGEAGALESSVQAALKPIGVVGSNNNQQQAATRTLHEKLWQPIAAAVGNASKVVFSPDGLLNLVPFVALQDADGRYLIESRQISYVTSGRDLTKGDLGIKPESELYLAANPQFDLAAIPTKAAATDESTQGAVRSAGFGIHFSPLPGTAKEAKQIPPYLKGKQTVVTEERATEESVLAVRRPRVMHLSTHGFFLTDQIALTQGTRGFTRVKAAAQEETSKPAPVFAQGYENPLVRSGLAFAGANHAKEAQGGRDGVLTALEVSGMDLHGTDLVTLSACETGRGEVKSGEGVFGLRRAFALAGSRHLMMSLWPVSDEVTATQMQTFYQLYGKRTAPAAALRQAQLATIAELRSKRGQAEPALWAPFIVQGW